MYPKVRDILPHAEPMILIDEVVDFKEDYIEVKIVIHADSMFCKGGCVPNYVAIEYMAQSIAAWQGLKIAQDAKPKIGFLLGTRKINFMNDFFKVGDELYVKGKLNCMVEQMASFNCTLECGKEVLVTATLNVFQQE